MTNKERGFTLIELMMVCVLVAILASIAIPSYRSYVMRAQRSDATTALLRVQTAQEKLYLDRGRFTTNLTNKPSDPTPGLGLPSRSENGYYLIEIQEQDEGYIAIARPDPAGRQARDTRCAEFSINQSGIRTAKDSNGVDRTNECWR
ncbi:MAG TPA: type IV pilin protein [Steroidobacteraceae bacterium]